MSGHTPEPWIAVGNWVEHPAALVADICSCDPATIDQAHMGRSDAEIRANARRIVAAVNATAGISTEALEAGVVAKLVEALELADATLRGANMDKAHVEKVVSAALALAQGEQS